MLSKFIILATTVLALRANVDKDSGGELEGRIINGREARPFSFPFVVSLQENGRHFCGGTLLDSRTVLTAAHCTDEYPDNTITVNVRRHDLRKPSTEEGGQSIKITRQTSHPKFDYGAKLNDIAIWKLVSPITVPVSYVTLDDGEFADQVELPAEAIGWGRVNPNNNVSASRLQHTVLPIYDNQQCSEGHEEEIQPDSKVCAGYSEGISSTCQGDSGGPLFIIQGGRTIQIGITSFGKSFQCVDTDAPTVFTRVANFRSWIQREQRRS